MLGGFTLYDYREPLALPEGLLRSFSVIVADPPFLSEECLRRTAQTMRALAADAERPKYYLLTGAVMHAVIADALHARFVCFMPAFLQSCIGKPSNDQSCIAGRSPGAQSTKTNWAMNSVYTQMCLRVLTIFAGGMQTMDKWLQCDMEKWAQCDMLHISCETAVFVWIMQCMNVWQARMASSQPGVTNVTEACHLIMTLLSVQIRW